VPCRVGSQKAVEMVEQLLAGEAAQVPLDLAELHDTLVRTSICGLGQVALLPLVDALKKFPDDPSLTRILQGERS
jgi:NADH:ubiquinone oxidoreductase subunit F (NADH-binding)